MDWSRFEAAGDESAPPAPAGDEAFNPFPEEPAGGAVASDEFHFAEPASPAAEDEEFAFEATGAAPPTDEFHFVGSESPAATDEEFAFEPSDAAPPTDEFHFVESESPAATDEEFAFEPSAAAPPTDELHFIESESPAATDEEFAFETSPTDEFAFDEGATGAEDEFSFEEGPEGGERGLRFRRGRAGRGGRGKPPPLEFDTLSFEDVPPETGSPDEDFDSGLGAGASDELVFEESDDSSFAFSAETGEEDFPWGEPDETPAASGEFRIRCYP